MAPTDEQLDELVEWLRDDDRIGVLGDLMLQFPPASIVTTTPEAPLMIPAPGTEGLVTGYAEHDGRASGVYVTATLERTTPPHPESGRVLHKGDRLRAECDPDKLVLVRCPLFSVEDVREAIRRASELGA